MLPRRLYNFVSTDQVICSSGSRIGGNRWLSMRLLLYLAAATNGHCSTG
jgi:hypothetical protein